MTPRCRLMTPKADVEHGIRPTGLSHRPGADIGGDDCRVVQYVRGRADRKRAPVIEYVEAVGKIGYHLHVVFNPDHGETELVLDAQDEAGEILAFGAV